MTSVLIYVSFWRSRSEDKKESFSKTDEVVKARKVVNTLQTDSEKMFYLHAPKTAKNRPKKRELGVAVLGCEVKSCPNHEIYCKFP